MTETQIARAPLHRTRVALLMRREDGALRVALVDESTGAQFGSIELTERSLDAMQRVVEAALRVRKELALRYPDKPLLYESVGSSARSQLAVREDGARFERYLARHAIDSSAFASTSLATSSRTAALSVGAA